MASMTTMATIPEGEYSSFTEMYSPAQESDYLLAQLLGPCSPPTGEEHISGSIQSVFWSAPHAMYNNNYNNNINSDYYCLQNVNNSSFGFSQDSSSYSSSSAMYYNSDHHMMNGGSLSMDLCLGDGTNTSSYLIDGEMSDCNMDENVADLDNNNLLTKLIDLPKIPVVVEDHIVETKNNISPESSKKRTRATGEVQKNKRNTRQRKNSNTKNKENNDKINEEGKGLRLVQNSSGSCSEDDSNGSQDNDGDVTALDDKDSKALNSSGKLRASRGAATDPQSLYARKRRERINERLRILQNLVPNGTKVDISTMLEEAVEYVKFLQIQIKLLSSDDMWMYAPIAYNGMDIGLDLRLSMPR